MERLTEYHNGVAVIRDKALLKDAMRKLAGYEDAEELSAENGIEKITTEFAEYICDMCCGNLDDVRSQEEADVICDECKLGKFICDICNKYNEIDRFAGSELEKVLKKKCELERELKSYKDLEEQMEQILSVHQTMRDFVCACVEYYELSKTKPEIADAMLISHADAKKLKSYKDLEEQGLLLKLPCKVGDAIYKIHNNKVHELKVHSIELFSLRSYLVYFIVGNDLCCVISLDYNKTWFSSKAEAEKALAEMKGE